MAGYEDLFPPEREQVLRRFSRARRVLSDDIHCRTLEDQVDLFESFVLPRAMGRDVSNYVRFRITN